MHTGVKKKISDENGAAIVIALVFFLICAVVGSTVLTAASINAKAAQTYRVDRQNEYTISSAAGVVVEQLQDGVSVEFEYNGADVTPSGTQVAAVPGSLAELLWSWGTPTGHGEDIWEARAEGKAYELGTFDPLTIDLSTTAPIAANAPTVYATIAVGADLDYTVNLSSSEDMSAQSAYNETIRIYPVVEYDGTGRVLKVTWGNPVISKTGADALGGES